MYVKKNLKIGRDRYLNRYLFIVFGIMVAIFYLSHTPGEESAKQSDFVVTLMTHAKITVNESNIKLVTKIIRKGAHKFEYFLLTLSLIRYLHSIKFDRLGNFSKIYLWSGVISFLYACSDEFHQTFIPGRAGLFSDVLVDSVGILLGIIFVHLIRKLYKKTKK